MRENLVYTPSVLVVFINGILQGAPWIGEKQANKPS